LKDSAKLKDEIKSLRRENARLKKDNAYLTHRLEQLAPKDIKDMPHDKELFLSAGDIDNHKGYFSYLIGRMKLSAVYRLYDRVFFALKKLMLASKIWRYLPVALGVIGVISQFMLTLGSVVVIFPIMLVATVFFLAFSAVSYAGRRKELLRAIKGKRIYFMYPPVKPAKDGAFYASMQGFAGDGIVFAVTSSFLLCGISGAGKVSENVYFIHTSFYYTFGKKAVSAASDTVKIY
jgi:hypothetical protein